MTAFSRCLGLLFALLSIFCLGQRKALAAPDVLTEIKGRGELRIGMTPGFIPFEMKKPDGEWIGFDVDMIKAFAATIGVKPVFIDAKWEGIIPGVQAHRYDLIVSGMTITEERKQAVAFSDPYYTANQSILIPKKNIGVIKSLADLDQPKSTVVVQLGTTGDLYATKILKHAKLVRLDTEYDSASAVLLGKYDGFIFDKSYIALYQKRNANKVGALLTDLTKESIGIAARKKDGALITAYNEFLKGWRASGGYDKAIKTHFEEMPWAKDFPSLK
jgi:polar amino acid transport system substrate-binding protein